MLGAGWAAVDFETGREAVRGSPRPHRFLQNNICVVRKASL